MTQKRVVAGMSGGVDSSTTAALLQEQGYDVIGVALRFPLLGAGGDAGRSCCGIAGMTDARRVADRLKIPFYVKNAEEIFSESVIEYFFRSYLRGETPNPCVECNRRIKFGYLMELARTLGAEYLATGHYARISRHPDSKRWMLPKGRDAKRDQSYFLHPLTQDQLAHTLFPLGEMTKEQTRDRARAFGLPVSEKPGSQDICFIGAEDYRRLLAQRHPEALRDGPIVDSRGRVLGAHHGAAGFTVGQRKGIGLAAREPLYVLDVRPETNTVVVGPAEEFRCNRMMVGQVNWVALERPPETLEASVKVRYRQPERPALLRVRPDGRVEVRFREAQGAAAPGQSAVFYDGDAVIGGGIIESRPEAA